MPQPYDIAFIGHFCYDEITPFGGEPQVAPGSAVLCGAMAAHRVGARVAVVTRLARADNHLLDPLRAAGIDTYVTFTEDTTYMEVIHPSPDVDERRMFQRRSAGFFTPADVPQLEARRVHLAGITDQEFTLELIAALRHRGYELSVDMQSFVRQVDPATRAIRFADVPRKQEIVAAMDRVKLDVVEAELLTGHRDLAAAAAQFGRWGSRETVITRGDGVLARVDGIDTFEPFSNRSSAGRTGRGDTTFAGYLYHRLDHDVAESLRFAAALVSLKMETPGPFAGTRQQVLRRLAECHPARTP